MMSLSLAYGPSYVLFVHILRRLLCFQSFAAVQYFAKTIICCFLWNWPPLMFCSRSALPIISAQTENPVKPAYELVKEKQMQENVERMEKVLAERFGPGHKNQQEFSSFARSLVYGGIQIGTSNNLKDTDCEEKEVEEDPSYEPNPEEIATAEDDLHSEEDQRTVGKTSAQVCGTMSEL